MLLALAEQQGIRSDVIPRIATGFCGGMSRTGNLCGAVSGGVMGLGLALGRHTPQDSREPVYRAIDGFEKALAAVKSGTLRAESTVLALGKRAAVVRVEVTNGDRLVCVAQGTLLVSDRPAARKPA